MKGGVNQEGVDFYNHLIDELIANGTKQQVFFTLIRFNGSFVHELTILYKLYMIYVNVGITPFVTIMHFDYPLALQQKIGGFLNRSIV